MLKTTPTFTNPPLTEVICGVVFKKLTKFAIPHVGLLWQEYQPAFQNFLEVPPLEEPQESATENSVFMQELSGIPLPRFWFITNQDDEVIQIQNDRFLYNWKPGNDPTQYPRLESIYGKFQGAYEKFETFITESDLGTLDFIAYELTYSNTISAESGYFGVESLASIVPGMAGQISTLDGQVPVGVRCFTRYDIEEIGGFGLIEVRTFKKKDTLVPGLFLMLTVKGYPVDPLSMSRTAWFQKAREWISRNFTDITSSEVQTNYWGKQS